MISGPFNAPGSSLRSRTGAPKKTPYELAANPPPISPPLFPAPPVFQVALFTPTPKAARRVLEFFTAQINNDHTRKAYLNATRRFAEWCDGRGIGRLADVHPF